MRSYCTRGVAEEEEAISKAAHVRVDNTRIQLRLAARTCRNLVSVNINGRITRGERGVDKMVILSPKLIRRRHQVYKCL